MIQYDKSAFGLNLLFRLHGSGVYRATVFGFLSVGFLLLIRLTWYEEHAAIAQDALGHPYAIGVLVASISFLLVFRVQTGYGRYWEACTSIYHMTSKWMDATTHAAIYHLQCEHYDGIKPPSYFEYPALNDRYLTRDREDPTLYDNNNTSTENGGTGTVPPESRGIGRGSSTLGSVGASSRLVQQEAQSVKIRAVHKSIESVRNVSSKRYVQRRASVSQFRINTGDDSSEVRRPTILMGDERLDGNWGPLFPDRKATFYNYRHPNRTDPAGFASLQGGRTPPLFLQELAHLSSLLIGVAFSTLRNDIEGAESPLGVYDPGCPWPEVDPDKDRNLFYHHQGPSSVWYKFLRFIGMGHSAEDRTRYNASRPMPILGGVSTGEIRFLQMARGPYAKTQLAWQWLSEFIIREQLAGSLGAVGPPIVSRCFQFLGDGMIYYNHARKIMFIPFPIPHAQLTAVFVIIMIPAVALLMDQYITELWLGCCLTFLTTTALGGMNEVARELENPFRNVPNELPLVTLLAQANEALVTMYAGYHPDHFWKEAAEEALSVPPPHRKSSRSTVSMMAGDMAVEVKDELDRSELDATDSTKNDHQAGTTQQQEQKPKQQQEEELVHPKLVEEQHHDHQPQLDSNLTAGSSSVSSEKEECLATHEQMLQLIGQVKLLTNKIDEQQAQLERLQNSVVLHSAASNGTTADNNSNNSRPPAA